MSLNIVFLFFRNFVWITTTITLFECYLLAVLGSPQVILFSLWTKLASSLLVGLLFWLLQENRFYFYYNLGYSRFYLFASALVLDLLVWTIMVITTSVIA